MEYCIIYNDLKYGEKELAHFIHDNVDTRGMSVHDAVKTQMEWVMDNCENTNDIFLSNSFDYLWYNLIGIYGKTVENEINDAITQLIAKGDLKIWQ